MSFSSVFVKRPIATTLLTLGVALAGIVAFDSLPVSPLPQVDFPTISVRASMAGASPQVMASTVATPLERHLGQIADVSEMTSSSSVGSARITLQFGLDRDIDGAARDVQAAINAARADLPTSLRSNPTYRKVNPADAPIMILALTSTTLTRGQIYDAADTVIQEKLSQITGVGEVDVSGSSLPAVRVELNPQALANYGIALEDVRAALSSANAHAPKGAIQQNGQNYQIYTNDQASKAQQYQGLIVAYRNGAAVRLSDVAQVNDSTENLRNFGLANGEPAVLVVVTRSPGANIISTIDSITEALPQLEASIPSDIKVQVVTDRSTTIRASLHDVERTLTIAVVLVIVVVFLFLRDPRAGLIPTVAVPVSLLGTIAAMWLLGFSLDNLSLMALTISTGFVVDDAIVVLENIMRHIEAGMSRLQATLLGAREVGFTVLSMSVSLVAVFIPILLMGGIIGRLFREFAITLSVAILVSLAVSLTTTPMMCALFLRRPKSIEEGEGWFGRMSERAFGAVHRGYERSLAWALDHALVTLGILAATLCLNVFLFIIVPKGFFPQQDTGRLIGGLQADQSISFQLMRSKLTQMMAIVSKDKAVASVAGFTGGGQTNFGSAFVTLKPLSQRNVSADAVINRLRRNLSQVPGASLFLQSVQDVRVGGRQSNAQYQYTMQGDDLDELYSWAPKVTAALQQVKELTDVNSDFQQHGLETDLKIDRSSAARLGITVSQIDNTLYDAFGQRQVSTIFNPLNQYHVVMEVEPRYWQDPSTLNDIYISTAGAVSSVQSTNALAGTTASSGGTAGAGASLLSQDAVRNQQTNALTTTGRTTASTGASVSTSVEKMVPLSAVSTYGPGTTPLAVNHQGLAVASTVSFNLAPGVSLSDATAAIDAAVLKLGVPTTIRGTFQGTAQVFQSSLKNEPVLVLAALLTVYIVLGVLYESYVHPITILSTLPSAGVGAVLALLVFKTQFDIIALIGVFLLIGIVKKNAIMMIDFAIHAQRANNLAPREAIFDACMLRLRPILMTTMAAIFGALPLALGHGEGSEIRRPLGIAIIGGLIVSQLLTLYTTPVIYLYLDRFRVWASTHLGRHTEPLGGEALEDNP
ncbi:MAG TPA: efflux RND transporter permease subunit [Stellaceae bacterium]|jgi:multidrug efflux pump|nr:efflux RND transporter permease subunit [Stellaceae bacterium]